MRIAFAIALLIPATAMAQPMRCATPPRAPLCLDRLQAGADASSLSQCRSETRSYASQMTRYSDCLQDEATRARQERDRAERKLDCLQSGSGYCS
ncbi:hypothetical protein [Ferrovibrio sp.]|uniref:hypothetical protein n=1 Tax=Ferrovibrio sp. TaxID=1917215 RepID=UPI0025BE2964|nr:hypothetical protein [Ferrovibrio sp.]MBX3456113.1 hypothetical protein [Ferrovibrio sp.]